MKSLNTRSLSKSKLTNSRTFDTAGSLPRSMHCQSREYRLTPTPQRLCGDIVPWNYPRLRSLRRGITPLPMSQGNLLIHHAFRLWTTPTARHSDLRLTSGDLETYTWGHDCLSIASHPSTLSATTCTSMGESRNQGTGLGTNARHSLPNEARLVVVPAKCRRVMASRSGGSRRSPAHCRRAASGYLCQY